MQILILNNTMETKYLQEDIYYLRAIKYLNEGKLETALYNLTQSLFKLYEIHGFVENKEIAATLHHLGHVNLLLNKYDDAEGYFYLTLSMKRNMYPKGHYSVNNTLNDYANLLMEMGIYDVPINFYNEILDTEKYCLNTDIKLNHIQNLINCALAHNKLGHRIKEYGMYIEARNLIHDIDDNELTDEYKNIINNRIY